MDARKILEYKGRDIFFDPYYHKYYVWDNGKKIYRITTISLMDYIDNLK